MNFDNNTINKIIVILFFTSPVEILISVYFAYKNKK